jgi:non-canonical purine NTP pyrophosphatase (RdgB/HAM1 family)
MKLLFATTNAAKLASVSRVLGSYGITVERRDIELPELQGESAAEIAAGKATAAYAYVNAPVMVIDSALHIDALGGFPGPNVKWATRQIGIIGYLDLLARHADRSCRFEDAIAYLDAMRTSPLILVRSERGTIAPEPRGNPAGHKSPMATLFIPDGCDKTIAEMSPEEYHAYRTRPETERVYRDFAGTLTGTPTSFE